MQALRTVHISPSNSHYNPVKRASCIYRTVAVLLQLFRATSCNIHAVATVCFCYSYLLAGSCYEPGLHGKTVSINSGYNAAVVPSSTHRTTLAARVIRAMCQRCSVRSVYSVLSDPDGPSNLSNTSTMLSTISILSTERPERPEQSSSCSSI